MNLILLFEDEIDRGSGEVHLTGRRHKHIVEVLRSKEGDHLSVGLANGRIGTGRLTRLDGESARMQVEFMSEPPQPLGLTLVLALPRPQVIKRTLLCAASLGIKKIVLLNFARVEKSFWQSSSLKGDAIENNIVLGLEQAKDTLLPSVVLRKSFKKFVEDELPELAQGTLSLVAHPGSAHLCPREVRKPVTLVIGPEGGLTAPELEAFKKLGFQDINLGRRILRVESVLPFVAGRLS